MVRFSLRGWGGRETWNQQRAFTLSALMTILITSVLITGPLSADTGEGVTPLSSPTLPGLTGDPTLEAELRASMRARSDVERPRTGHLLPSGEPRYVNRLVKSTSPYLLQHAHNPVNWYPWGEEAFADATRLDRPILLSVGYSTCHWCHVMEHESFEDEEIAALINQRYIAIKVDREERPDVDAVYMDVVHLLRGRGGWPMTVLMTPTREPFFAGTYFPARDGDRGRRRGFLSILRDFASRYQGDRSALIKEASANSERLRRAARPRPPAAVPKPTLIEAAVARFNDRFDLRWGGLGRAPKFPRPATLELLLRYHRRSGDLVALEQVAHTLQAMAYGGIYDQVGGGFHRYSVDRQWRIPHFEKMLYDNAQLIPLYLSASLSLRGAIAHWSDDLRTSRWRRQSELFERIGRESADYLLRELEAPHGGFYSATDADSLSPSGERQEGHFFTWTPAEIRGVIGPQGLRRATVAYGVSARGQLEGRNQFHFPRHLSLSARRLGMGEAALWEALSADRAALYAHRARRPPPLLDKKIIVAWNGLAIHALAYAAFILKTPRYFKAAGRAARWIWATLRDEAGRVHRSWRGETSVVEGYLDDYSALTRGMLSLYSYGGELSWLRDAQDLQRELEASYQSPEGAYFRSSIRHERLLVRERPAHDGALPSGRSLTAENLIRLYHYTGEQRYQRRADRLFRASARDLKRAPTSAPALLGALEARTDRIWQVVLVRREAERGEQSEALRSILRALYLPNLILFDLSEAEVTEQKATLTLLEGKIAQAGSPTAYLCDEGGCLAPIQSPDKLAAQLMATEPLLTERSTNPLSPQKIEDPFLR